MISGEGLDSFDTAESWSPSSSSAASVRWSRIPFDILDDWQVEAKKAKTECASRTCISDIPEPIVAWIFSLISDVRTRNSLALVCTDWYSLERATRLELCLRGNTSDLYLIPRSFQAVERLDLSQCSPWGYSLFQSIPERALLVGHLLKQAFPRVKHMIVYARDVHDIQLVACFWPDLQSLKLVRWHQRPTLPEGEGVLGVEFLYLMKSCKALQNLDLSQFYYWTEDIPPALQVEPVVSGNLRSLNLLKVSGDGFKESEVEAIATACQNLEELQIVVVFDSRLLDAVGDATVLHIAVTCKKLRVLHLVDSYAFDDVRGDPEEGFSDQDAGITVQGLISAFQALPFLEDLKFVLSSNVRDAAPAMEALSSHCRRLTSLSLGHFHGLCKGPQPGGITLCIGLKGLSIKNCADLNDADMVAIANGCTGLQKLWLQSCRGVSRDGIHTVAYKLRGSLKDVKVLCCLLMDSVSTLWALQPIQGTIEHLHMDCIMDADFAAGDSTLLQNVYGIAPDVMPQKSALAGKGKTHVLPLDAWNGYGEPGKGLDLNLDSQDYGQSGNGLDLNLDVQDDDGENQDGNGLDLNLDAQDDGENEFGNGLDLNRCIFGSGVAVSKQPANVHNRVAENSNAVNIRATVVLEKSDSCAQYSTGCNGKSTSHESATGCPTNFCLEDPAMTHGLEGNVAAEFSLGFRDREWDKLKSLSLWIPVSQVLYLLPRIGLQFCPSVQEVTIKVQGDSRLCHKPIIRVSGISTLASYPLLSKLTLDCSETVGYALSAPKGHMDLSLWERWYLQGIQSLKLYELDYWPPQDKDANRRGISLVGSGLISQCATLRKLILHGTINEHFLKMFLNIPNLRDVQLRIDYYPAPDDDMNTDMRADACKRFEVDLTERGFPD